MEKKSDSSWPSNRKSETVLSTSSSSPTPTSQIKLLHLTGGTVFQVKKAKDSGRQWERDEFFHLWCLVFNSWWTRFLRGQTLNVAILSSLSPLFTFTVTQIIINKQLYVLLYSKLNYLGFINILCMCKTIRPSNLISLSKKCCTNISLSLWFK